MSQSISHWTATKKTPFKSRKSRHRVLHGIRGVEDPAPRLLAHGLDALAIAERASEPVARSIHRGAKAGPAELLALERISVVHDGRDLK